MNKIRLVRIRKRLLNFTTMIMSVDCQCNGRLSNEYKDAFLTNHMISYYAKSKGYPILYNIARKHYKIDNHCGEPFYFDCEYPICSDNIDVIINAYDNPRVKIFLEAFKHFKSLETDILYNDFLPFKDGYEADDIIKLMITILSDLFKPYLVKPITVNDHKINIDLQFNSYHYAKEYNLTHLDDIYFDFFNIFMDLNKMLGLLFKNDLISDDVEDD